LVSGEKLQEILNVEFPIMSVFGKLGEECAGKLRARQEPGRSQAGTRLGSHPLFPKRVETKTAIQKPINKSVKRLARIYPTKK
jgi:hypothetical protein